MTEHRWNVPDNTGSNRNRGFRDGNEPYGDDPAGGYQEGGHREGDDLGAYPYEPTDAYASAHDDAGFYEDEPVDGPWLAPNDDDRGGLRPGVIAVAAGIVLVAGVSAVWWFGGSGDGGGLPEHAPLIAAPEGPFKERPLDAGGLQVPHQDRQILQALGGRDAPEQVERLLPGPEEPVPLAPDIPAQPTAAGDPDGQSPGEALVVEERDFAQVPSQTGDTSDGQDGDDQVDRTVGFDGREDQIAALIERMGILDDDISDPVAQPDMAEPEAAIRPDQGEEAPPSPDIGQETADPVPPPSPQIGPVSDGGFRVQLGSVDSSEAARNEWARLSSRHGELLGALTMSVQEADISGRTWYRVQAGPLDRETAERLCRELEGRNAGCMVVRR